MGIQKITTHLCFDHQAEDAVKFYVSVFGEDSGIDAIVPYSDEGQEIHGMKEGSIMTVDFHLRGQSFIALNGGPHFQFNEAISFVITCNDQNEIDYFWNKLSADPNAEQCGWLKDKYGVSWQVVPEGMNEMLTDDDPEKVKRAMRAMLQMKKIDIQKLRDAFKGARL
ncbi:MAG: VOC family protein [Balneolaceae bacterium]